MSGAHRSGRTPSALRLLAAFGIGVLLPHAQNALDLGLHVGASAFTAPDAAPGGGRVVLQAAAWALALLPGAALVARLAGTRVKSFAAAAAAGALAALAAPFVGYALPIGTAAARLLWPHALLLGVLWPLLIVALARRRRR